MTDDLLLTRVGLPDGSEQDLLIHGGVIARIAPSIVAEPGVTRIAAEGRKVFPGFVDGHSHLDKNLLGMPWYRREAGRSLTRMIADERAFRARPEWDYERQISRQIEVMVAAGTAHTRAFVDIDTDNGLAGFDAMVAMREKYRGILDMQIIAFGQSGVQIRPGTAELIEEAAARGADFIGGLDPCLIERDPVGHVDWLFATADRYGVGVDVHLHERGEMGLFSAELVIDRARAHNMPPGTVMLSHPHFLGDLPAARATAVIDAMAELGIMATDDAQPAGEMASLVQLQDAGVVLTAGCDGIGDTWAPMNHSDMLFKGYQLAWRHQLTADDELARVVEVITHGGAAAMGLTDYGVVEGARADLVLVDVDVHVQAIVTIPRDRLVIKAGRVVARDGEYLL